MSEQRNLLLAIVLSMIVVFGWQFYVGPPKPTPDQLKQQQQTAQQTANPAAPGVAGAPQGQKLPRDAAVKQASGRAPIETPTLAGSINLTGGRFDDLRLKNYHETPDPKSPEIELLSP